MVKKYAYILDEHLGEVHFPLSAAQHMESSVNDLREKYQSDEHVIFTANKQLNQNNEFEYRAVSVVKPKELLTVCGRITDIVPNRFCYTEVKKYGKVFVPFSARLNATPKHWLGKGAEKNKEVNLKIFPQPQINGCNYVAYSISLPSEGGIVETTKVNGVEAIYDQIGIIVEIPPQPNADLKVFCNVSGFARLPGAFRKSWMTKGRHIKYDAIKQQHPSQEKIHWAIRKCTDLGQLFKKVDENPMKPDSLTLELCAVINRVVPNPPNRCAWFWNDFIGRIYCYPNNYTPGLNVMECVKCKVVYTGAFDDVPWSAYDIELLGEDDDVRFAAAQMLVTRDDWTVTYAENKKISFIGFLESPSMSPQQCFLAWTDLADSDAPPSVGQKCRATVYYQIRKDKQQWRAVLITPLNPNGIPTSNHPLYSGSREIIWPDPIEPPVVESSPATTVSSPGITSFGPPGFDHMTNIPPPIGAGMRPYNSMVKMNGLAKQESSSSVLSMISNGHERNGTTHQYSHPPPPVNQNTFTLDSMTPLPPLEGLTFAHLQNADNPRSSPMERNGASGTDFMHMFTNGWHKGPNQDPKQDLFQAFGPGSFIGSTAEIDTRDMETQTDTIVEHEVLRDVLKNTDCLTVILKNFPDHTAKIMSMSALLR